MTVLPKAWAVVTVKSSTHTDGKYRRNILPWLAMVAVDKPASTADVCATIYQYLGIDPETTVYDRSGRPVPVAHGTSLVGTYSATHSKPLFLAWSSLQRVSSFWSFAHAS
jgi:hypothetical protein